MSNVSQEILDLREQAREANTFEDYRAAINAIEELIVIGEYWNK